MSATTSGQSFDLQDPDYTRRLPMPEGESSYPDDTADPEDDDSDPLDSPEADQLHNTLMTYYQEEAARQSTNRFEMATDEDFYDGIQWDAEEARTLRDRGQAPLVLNVIAQTINWITGTERRGRNDFNVLPRKKDGEQAAQRKTELLKYLSDVSHTGFKRSRAFKDAAVVGLGWLEDCLGDPNADETIISRYESWRNILWDSASSEPDLSDCRYLFRMKWTDLDMAASIFQTRKQVLLQSAGDAGRMGAYYAFGDEVADQREIEREINTGGGLLGASGRQRVRMMEAWFVRPQPITRLQGSQFHGEIFDMFSPTHQQLIATTDGQGNPVKPQATLVTAMGLRMWVAIFCEGGMLYLGETPYRHNKYPFTPIWGYRYGRTLLPYGIVRQLRGLQEDINKRFSKALFILSSNKVKVEVGAVPNMKEFMDEVARPDGVIQVVAGRMAGVELEVDRDLAPAHLELMRDGIGMVQQVGGVTDEMMGRTTNAHSGVAIQARQMQGQMSTSELFDNLRLAFKLQGEKQLSMIEQFFSEEKSFRITNERGTPQYITINDSLPENDITRTKADFIIGEEDWRTSIRQAQADQLFDLISKLPPQVSIVLLDLVIEHMDLPNVEAIIARIRAINGQHDPDQTEMTPLEVARQQAAQQQQQMAQLRMQLEMAELQSKTTKNQADAARLGALQQQLQEQAALLRAQAIKIGADTVVSAVSAAEGAIMPGVAAVADALLDEVGFVPAQVKAVMDIAMQRAQARQQELLQGQQAGAALLGKGPGGNPIPSNLQPAPQGQQQAGPQPQQGPAPQSPQGSPPAIQPAQ